MSNMIFKNRAQAKSISGLSYIGNINSSAKIVKNKKVNNYTYVIYLAAASTSGYNVCTHSTAECRLGCLNTSGRVKMESENKHIITDSRIRKTKLFYEHREFFMRWVIDEIKSFKEKAKRDNYNFSIRLNGTSDIEWESIIIDGKNLFQMFPDIQFYDYTKNINRFLNKALSKNYYLTYSYSGRNKNESLYLLSKGYNVAVVFNTKKATEFPEYWNGYKVLNGDLTDYRPLDERGCVVGLTWKTIANKTNDNIIRNSVFVEQIKKIKMEYVHFTVGDFYGLNGEIANMLHIQIADKLAADEIIKLPDENTKADTYLRENGWITIHDGDILYDGYYFGKEITPQQQHALYVYGQYYTLKTKKLMLCGINKTPLTGVRIQSLDKIQLKKIFDV